MSTTPKNSEKVDNGVGMKDKTNKVLSSIKVVLKSVSNLCDVGAEDTVDNAKVYLRLGESGTTWKDKINSTKTTSAGHSKKKDIQFKNETFNFNCTNVKAPELVIRVYDKAVKDGVDDVDKQGTKMYLGETIVLIENNPTTVNMEGKEQSVTLQGGSRENVVVKYFLSLIHI